MAEVKQIMVYNTNPIRRCGITDVSIDLNTGDADFVVEWTQEPGGHLLTDLEMVARRVKSGDWAWYDPDTDTEFREIFMIGEYDTEGPSDPIYYCDDINLTKEGHTLFHIVGIGPMSGGLYHNPVAEHLCWNDLTGKMWYSIDSALPEEYQPVPASPKSHLTFLDEISERLVRKDKEYQPIPASPKSPQTFLEEISERLVRKGKEYQIADESEPLFNAEMAGELLKQDAVQVAWTWTMKHIISVNEMVARRGEVGYPIDVWEEKLGDIIGYSSLIVDQLRHEREKTE